MRRHWAAGRARRVGGRRRSHFPLLTMTAAVEARGRAVEQHGDGHGLGGCPHSSLDDGAPSRQPCVAAPSARASCARSIHGRPSCGLSIVARPGQPRGAAVSLQRAPTRREGALHRIVAEACDGRQARRLTRGQSPPAARFPHARAGPAGQRASVGASSAVEIVLSAQKQPPDVAAGPVPAAREPAALGHRRHMTLTRTSTPCRRTALSRCCTPPPGSAF
jgi:hypothetical protein